MTFDRETIEKLVSKAIRWVIIVFVGLVGVSLIGVELNKLPDAEIQKKMEEQRLAFEALGQDRTVNANLPAVWPPEMNTTYPEFELIDQYGVPFKTSDLRGRVVIVEYIDMSSPVSQAQSGANDVGALGLSVSPDPLTSPVGTVLEQSTFGEVTLPHPQILELKVIVYGLDGSQASRDDAYDWAQHFDLKKENNVVVAVPVKDMRDDLTQQIVTGYQLLDKSSQLRVDSAGLEPKHSLTLTFAPMVPKLAR